MNNKKEGAKRLLSTGKPAQAAKLLQKACKKKPEDAESWTLLGITHGRVGALGEAESCLREAIRLQPTAAPAHRLLAGLLAHKHHYAEAIKHYKKTLELKPSQPNIYIDLGNCLKEERHTQEAINAFLDSLKLNPQQYMAHRNLGQLYDQIHRTKEARRHAELALKHNPLDIESDFLIAQLDAREKKFDMARQRFERLLLNNLSSHQRAMVTLELGRLLDKLKEYDAAFELIQKGNRLLGSAYKPHKHESDLQGYRQEIDRYRSIFTRELSTTREHELSIRSPLNLVFLVGFPRSGTTLTEQILESHPDFDATHELPVLPRLTRNIKTIIGRSFSYPRDMASLNQNEATMLRATYLQQMEEKLGYDIDNKKYLLDKLPLNIINIGLISRLFPEARILVALRDPRDVCLSCFMQTFNLNQAMRQFLEIDDTAKFYATVMGLWLHYRNTLRINYLETRYEDIVDDLEGAIKRILDFVGANWDANVMEFYKGASTRPVHTPSYQSVTQPIYRNSIAKWQHYDQQLRSVTPSLDTFIKEFGYRPVR